MERTAAVSYAETTEGPCPSCDQLLTAQVWVIVDAHERPDLVARIRAGALHDVICPHCGEDVGEVDAPVVLYRARRDPPVLFLPAKHTTAEEDDEHATALVVRLRENLGAEWQDDWVQPLNWVSQELARFVLSKEAAGLTPMEVGTLAGATLAFSQADSWDEARRILDENPGLLSDLADRMLAQLAADQETSTARQHVEDARALLRRCREIGIEEALAERIAAGESQPQAFPDELVDAIRAFLAPSTWQGSREVLELLGDLLLSDEADLAFAKSLEILGDDPAMEAFVLDHRAVLSQTRTEGIDLAFADLPELKTAPAITRETWRRAGMVPPEEREYRLPEDFLGAGALQAELEMLAQMIEADPNGEIGLLPDLLVTQQQVRDVPRRIELFRSALGLVDRGKLPVLWAALKINLAAHLIENPAGDPVADSNEAMRHCMDLVTDQMRERFPQLWAWAHHLMGEAYRNRTVGDPGENVERAIGHYRRALELRTRDSFPDQWASTQHVLGAAYAERVRGTRSDNLEEAIACYRRALEVRTAETHSDEWALTEANLGNAYADRILGEPTQNQEEAIACYLRALRTFNPRDHSDHWANTQNSLGTVYRRRNRGDPAGNVERAIACYERALEVWTREEAPWGWAMANTNLANAFMERIEGFPEENLEYAIQHFHSALEVYTRHSHPHRWAAIQTNMGIAHQHRPYGDRTENIEQGIKHLQGALTVYSRDVNPERWAAVQLNLAGLHQAHPGMDRRAHLGRAIACCRQSLGVFTAEAYPAQHQQAAAGLGELYLEERNWPDALAAFRSAILAADRLYEASATPEARQAELRAASGLSARAAYCLARLDRPAQAVETLEQGLTRALGEVLARSEAALLDARAEDLVAFSDAQAQIIALEAESRAVGQPGARDYLVVSDGLRRARKELSRVVARIRGYLPEFMPVGLDYGEINAVAVAVGQPLVYLLACPAGSLALVVPAGSGVRHAPSAVWLDNWTSDDLHTFLYGEDGDDWCSYLGGTIMGDVVMLRRALDRSWSVLQARLLAPLVEHLSKLDCQKAVLIPTGNLSLVPLHALTLEAGAYTYAPSARALRSAANVEGERAGLQPVLLGIGNPLPSLQTLPFARTEVEVIAPLFAPDAQCQLYEEEATRTAVWQAIPGSTHLHFSCHGRFDLDQALRSALFLAGEDQLTLRELLDGGLDLSAARLAVLSACQTGITDFQNVPDEAVGFPAGFLQAGVPGVISTLWPVNDLSTALLMGEFYRRHLAGGQELAEALRGAQLWLRDATAEEMRLAERYEGVYRASGRRDEAALRWMRYYGANPEVQPFAHPYYWAGFVFSGV